MSLGNRLKSFAIDKYGGIKNLAAALEISQPHLSQYITNRNKPGTEMLIKLAELGCDVHWLLTGENKSPPSIIERDDKIKELEAEINTLRDELRQVIIHLQALENIEKFIATKKGKVR